MILLPPHLNVTWWWNIWFIVHLFYYQYKGDILTFLVWEFSVSCFTFVMMTSSVWWCQRGDLMKAPLSSSCVWIFICFIWSYFNMLSHLLYPVRVSFSAARSWLVLQKELNGQLFWYSFLFRMKTSKHVCSSFFLPFRTVNEESPVS